MHTVLILSQKGGTGKSTLAEEIAFSFDRTCTPYNYYNLDSQGGSYHKTVERDDAVISIVDTPGYISDELPAWIKGADLVVIPTRASMRDQEPFERTREAVHTHAPDLPVIIAVNQWNRYTANRNFVDWLEDTLTDNERMIMIPASESILRSGMHNQSVTDFSKQSPAAKAIRSLTNMIRAEFDLPTEIDI